MKKFFLILCFVYTAFQSSANASPRISFEDLLIQSELNPQNVLQARETAIRQGIPVSIMTSDRIMIDAKYVEDGRPVYAVYTNFADIYDGICRLL